MSNSDGSDSDEDTFNEKLSSVNKIQVIIDVQSDRIDHKQGLAGKFEHHLKEIFPGIQS